MGFVMNLIVLIFEILYYSMFMIYARRDGKKARYYFAFSIITIFGLLIGTKDLWSYLVLILLILFGLKFIVKVKTSLYDMLVIVIMLFLNMIIQLPIYLICYKLLAFNHFLTTMLFQVIKVLLIYTAKNKLNPIYLKLKRLWDNNNFYIRYIFSCSMFVYVITIFILIVNNVRR